MLGVGGWIEHKTSPISSEAQTATVNDNNDDDDER
jgi:hypothetical protein